MDPTTRSSTPTVPAATGAPPIEDGLAAEWDALADGGGVPPYLRPGWFAAWWAAFGTGELEVRVARRSGRLTAVLPLARSGGHLGSPTNAHSPAFGPIARDPAAARDLLVDVVADGGRVRLSGLGAAENAAVAEAAEAAGRPVLSALMQRSPYVDLEHPDDRPHRRFKADLRRRRRRLSELGEVDLDVYRGGPDLPARLDEGLGLEAAGWKGDRNTAILGRPALHEFYGAVAAWASGRDALRLYFLRLDGAAVAFVFALTDGRAVHLVKSGLDPAFARFSPSQLLLEDVIARARQDGARHVELLGGEEPYKQAWTGRTRDRMRVDLFSASVKGRLVRSALVHRANALRGHPA
ncbi:MAG TPA: GNAT family N-acetyltransferase, partial [Solirubrobacteraceae bacterium]